MMNCRPAVCHLLLSDARGKQRLSQQSQGISAINHQQLQATMAMCNSTQFIAAFCIWACVADDQDGSPRHRQQSMKWAQDPRDWTVNDWEKVARSDKSRFLVHYVHGRAHIRQLPTVAVTPGCAVGRTQAVGGCVIQWAMFSWDTLGPIIPIAQLLTAVRYMNINADQVQRYVNAYSDRQAG